MLPDAIDIPARLDARNCGEAPLEPSPKIHRIHRSVEPARRNTIAVQVGTTMVPSVLDRGQDHPGALKHANDPGRMAGMSPVVELIGESADAGGG